jgi:hypothetical protein
VIQNVSNRLFINTNFKLSTPITQIIFRERAGAKEACVTSIKVSLACSFLSCFVRSSKRVRELFIKGNFKFAQEREKSFLFVQGGGDDGGGERSKG